MKVLQSTQLINPFGGIQFVLKHLKAQGIDAFIDAQLGSRGDKKEYSKSDGLPAIHYSHLCGGSCLEEINTLVEHIGFHPDLSLPSADTALRVEHRVYIEEADQSLPLASSAIMPIYMKLYKEYLRKRLGTN